MSKMPKHLRDLRVTVVTEPMGSCYCHVYGDGTIQYDGAEDWQQSERIPFDPAEPPTRVGGLTIAAYADALDKLGDYI